jgi:hypothetical protein
MPDFVHEVSLPRRRSKSHVHFWLVRWMVEAVVLTAATVPLLGPICRDLGVHLWIGSCSHATSADLDLPDNSRHTIDILERLQHSSRRLSPDV